MPVTENKMGYMSIRPLMISMSLPAIISMTINALYNIVDSYFVARISEDALTAVSIIMPLQMMIIAVGVGTGVGINSLISRRLGARRQEDADKAATTGILLGVCNWLVFMLVGLLLPGAFVSAYAKPGTYIYEAATQYLMIVFCGSFFIFVQVNLEKILQATGNMKAPMICSMSGAITNVILDPIMIFGLLGFPKLGVVGAAIATVIGQVVGFTIGVCILFGGKNHLVNIRFKGFRPEKRIIKEIYQVALPSIIMQSIASVMNVLYNMILVAYSTTAVAVLGVYFKIQSFVFMPVFGLNQGVLPIIGFNYGARNKERVKEARKEGIRLALFFMVIGLILFQTIPDKLLLIFDASPKMLEYGVPALRIISLNFIPAAFGIMNGTVFQATGHGVYSLICSFIRQLVGIVPFAYLLAKIGGVTLSWFSFPIGEVLGLIYSFAMLNKLMKNEIDAL
ncbi:MAG: MATE family efflux transporter [Firmicutes bacterium]|nr:MATE family efflux transporter [Bacillota bacterium]MBR6956423.1 MATE family efflux transporter [Bacillota bacterium]